MLNVKAHNYSTSPSSGRPLHFLCAMIENPSVYHDLVHMNKTETTANTGQFSITLTSVPNGDIEIDGLYLKSAYFTRNKIYGQTRANEF